MLPGLCLADSNQLIGQPSQPVQSSRTGPYITSSPPTLTSSLMCESTAASEDGAIRYALHVRSSVLRGSYDSLMLPVARTDGFLASSSPPLPASARHRCSVVPVHRCAVCAYASASPSPHGPPSIKKCLAPRGNMRRDQRWPLHHWRRYSLSQLPKLVWFFIDGSYVPRTIWFLI